MKELCWNRVKIVATAGPACNNYRMLKAMVKTGLDVIRINFSHGKYDDYKNIIAIVRKIEAEIKRPLSILADMPGPKLRVKNLLKPLNTKNFKFVRITKSVPKSENELNIAYPVIIDCLKAGDDISISDGKIKIRVFSTGKGFVDCKVITGGTIENDAGLNFPEVDLPIPSVTNEDYKHIEFATESGVDFIGLSFIKDANDLKKVRAFLKKIKQDVFLISKIERKAAISNLDSIIKATDGVMVARGDLGVEMPIEQIAILQKEIIKKCAEYGKPVITATQMLESMIENPTPTRAEVSDVANAIYDGTDAIMLSGETAVGKYPLEAVNMMFKISKQVEENFDYTKYINYLESDNIRDIISKNVVRISTVYNVKDILIPTQTGRTARMVSRYRPKARIIALPASQKIQRQLNLVWGIYPCIIKERKKTEGIFDVLQEYINKSKLFKKGEKIIIAAGAHEKKGNSSNFIKVTTV